MGCTTLNVRWAKLSAASLSACVALCLVASAASADQAPGLGQAKAALLVKSDFPSGWSSQGSVTTSNGGGDDASGFPGGAQGMQQLATCLGANPALLRMNPPNATSPTFSAKGGTWTVQDNVSVFSSANLARQAYGVLSSPKTPACMASVMQNPTTRQQLAAGFGQGTTMGTPTVTAPNSSWRVPHSGGFTMSIPVTSQGQTLKVDVTLIAMARGRIASSVSFSSVGPPFSASLVHHLLTTAYGRT